MPKKKRFRMRLSHQMVVPTDAKVFPADVQQLSVWKEEVPSEQLDWSPSLDQEDPPEPSYIKEEQEELWISQEGEQLEEHDISRFQNLKDSFKQQLLTATREDLMGHCEMMIYKYEKEIDRQQKLLDVVLKPEVKLQRVFTADIQQLIKPEQQDWSPSLDPPEPPQIKEEQEELWTNQEGEQLQEISRFQDLKISFKQQLLTVAREDLMGHFEMMISEYEKEINRQQKLLCVVLKPEVKLQREAFPADIQQLAVSKEEEEWSPSLDQDEPPEPPHIKKEQEELWTSQEREQLQELEVAEFTFTPVPVKGGDDEQKPHTSQLHHRQTGQMVTDGEDCKGPEPNTNSDPDRQLDIDDKTEDSSEPETDDCDKDWKDPDRKTFGCSVCGKIFKHRRNMYRHIRTHTGDKPFSCSVCSKSYRHKGVLTYHMATHTREKPFSCSDCGKRFKGISQLKIHKCISESHRNQSDKCKKILSCYVCDATFPNNYLLKTHIRMHEGKELHTCTVCGTMRQYSSHLEIHMRTHTGERPYSCSVCGKRFSQRGIMNQHMAIHSGVKPYSCTVCGRRFFWRFQIKKHKCLGLSSQQTGFNGGRSEPLRIYNSLRRLNQDKEPKLCAETDNSGDIEFWKETRQHQSGLTYQRNKKVNHGHNSRIKPFSCSDMAKTQPKTDKSINIDFFKQTRQRHLKIEEVSHTAFSTDKKPSSCSEYSHTLQPHKKYYTGVTPFRCLFCEKAFASGGYLTRHISIHLGENLLCCLVCEKTCSLRSELMSHECVGVSAQLCHSKTVEQIGSNTLFSCSHCGKVFFREYHLQVHMRIHAGEKKSSCSVCSESLSCHMTCHTEEKPLHCSVCNMGFIDSESLIKHMRIHMRQTQFCCPICDKEFAWRRCLTKHMEVHAKGKLYRCDVCDRGFSHIYQLNYHECAGHENQTEDNREPLASNTAAQMKTEPDGPEPARHSDLIRHLQPDAPEPESEVGDNDWKETRESQSGLNAQKNYMCLTVGESFYDNHLLKSNRRDHAGEKPPNIKEEHNEVWISLDGEQLQGLEAKFTPVPVKSQKDGVKPQHSHLHQTEWMETDQEECRGSEPARSSDPDRQPDNDDSVDSDFWKEIKERPTDLSFLKDYETSESLIGCDSDMKDFGCSDDKVSESLEPETDNSADGDFWKDDRKPQETHKKHNCSECGKSFRHIHQMKSHMKSHVRQRIPFFCSVCGHEFLYKSLLKIHMRTHTGEKPFLCQVCGKKYAHKASMQSHMVVHTVEKQYTCNSCHQSFAWYTELKYHQCAAKS